MKKTSAYILLVFILFSCQKDNSTNPSPNPTTCTEPVATFKYKWNGTLYEMNGSLTQSAREGSLIRKEQTVNQGAPNPFDNLNGDVLNNTKYLFSIIATKNYFYSDGGEHLLDIDLRTTTFTAPKTYSNSAGDIKSVYFYYPDGAYNNGSQLFTVTISKFENGYTNGTFSGNVVTSGNKIIQITEGEFKNVKVLQ